MPPQARQARIGGVDHALEQVPQQIGLARVQNFEHFIFDRLCRRGRFQELAPSRVAQLERASNRRRSIFDRPAGLPDANFARGLITHHDGTRSDHAKFANRHAWANENIRANPGVFTDDNGRGDQRHIPAHEIVRPCAKMTVLADVGSASQRDVTEVVDNHVSAHH